MISDPCQLSLKPLHRKGVYERLGAVGAKRRPAVDGPRLQGVR